MPFQQLLVSAPGADFPERVRADHEQHRSAGAARPGPFGRQRIKGVDREGRTLALELDGARQQAIPAEDRFLHELEPLPAETRGGSGR